MRKDTWNDELIILSCVFHIVCSNWSRLVRISSSIYSGKLMLTNERFRMEPDSIELHQGNGDGADILEEQLLGIDEIKVESQLGEFMRLFIKIL